MFLTPFSHSCETLGMRRTFGGLASASSKSGLFLESPPCTIRSSRSWKDRSESSNS